MIKKLTVMVVAFASVSMSFASEKIITVGTTGDYKPLTWYDAKTKIFSGTSVQLVEQFAKDNHLKIKFVKTTWPMLSSDLKANKFEMAIGGISVTPERSKDFLLSNPIETSGKMALIRCTDKKKYTNLKSIDQVSVKVVENRGGTNEKFALNNLHQATLIIVPNNHLPFTYLRHKWADVMFTDAIEAKYKASQKIGLCAVTGYQYDQVAKVAIFNKNQESLQKEFNQWLKVHAKP